MCVLLVSPAGGGVTLLSMSGPGGGVRKRTDRKLSAVNPDGVYRPSRKPQTSTRSPYSTRPAEIQYAEDEESLIEPEVSGYLSEESVFDSDSSKREEADSEEGKKMAKKEEGEISKLVRYLVERDLETKKAEGEAKKAEAKDKMDREKREAEVRRVTEEARRADMMELFRQLKEEEHGRRREENDERRRDDEENRRRQRKEEDEQREKRELQQEKLKVLGVYKEGVELMSYLDKFERIMRECKIERCDWAERLFPRLRERLCARIAGVRDDGGEYDTVKGVLLKAVGETTLTYGHQLFE